MSKGARKLLGLLVVGVAISVVVIMTQKSQLARPVARISRDGLLLQEIDLTAVGEGYSFDLIGVAGAYNTLGVAHGRIAILAASCPDQVCVGQGYISTGTVPIVCLPNRVIIELVGGGDDLDAATG